MVRRVIMFTATLFLWTVMTFSLGCKSETGRTSPISFPKLSTLPEAMENLERGIFLFEQGNYEQSILEFDKAIKLDPKLTPAYNGRGIAYLDKWENEQATLIFNKAVALDLKFIGVYNNGGTAYATKDNCDAVIVDFNKAIELNPKFAEAYLNRGRAFEMQKNFNEAKADYEMVIRLSTNQKLVEIAIERLKEIK